MKNAKIKAIKTIQLNRADFPAVFDAIEKVAASLEIKAGARQIAATLITEAAAARLDKNF